ncbi:hypothetical protein NC652_040660 [Populus alba x Populus x berolinensis]|nr:hypothetical protein NC652_040660 [Populus alba x Populus x berolinensis]
MPVAMSLELSLVFSDGFNSRIQFQAIAVISDENHCRSSDSPLTFSLSLTVLCMVIGKRLGPRSNLLQIIRSPDESEILLLNRDGEEHTAVP